MGRDDYDEPLDDCADDELLEELLLRGAHETGGIIDANQIMRDVDALVAQNGGDLKKSEKFLSKQMKQQVDRALEALKPFEREGALAIARWQEVCARLESDDDGDADSDDE